MRGQKVTGLDAVSWLLARSRVTLGQSANEIRSCFNFELSTRDASPAPLEAATKGAEDRDGNDWLPFQLLTADDILV